MTIAAVDPVGDTVLTTVLPQVTGGTHAVARGADGDLLVHGEPLFMLATTITTDAGPTLVGTLGCANSPMVADAVSVGDGGFLVASSNNDPFDECFDPDTPGPASTVQVHRIADGGLTTGYTATLATAIERIQLAADGHGGAWLVYRAEGDDDLHLEHLDRDGHSTLSETTTGNALYEDTIDDWSTGYAYAHTWPGSPDNDTPPFIWLDIDDPDLVQQISTFDFAQPMGVVSGPPSILTSPDERSFLVTWHWDATTIAMLRAECL